MDVFSHALWANVFYGKARKYALWATVFTVLPDIIPFGPFFLQRLFFSNEPLLVNGEAHSRFMRTRPEMADIPRYVFALYNYTHSLVIFLAVLAAVFLLTRRVWWPLFGWALHVSIDIFSHSSQFFPTPFLWPISNFKVSFVSWGHPIFMAANISALATVYGVWYMSRRLKRHKTQTAQKTN